MYVTFDIEDWYNFCHIPALYNSETWWNYPAQIEENTHKILKLLEVSKLKANFFIVGAHAKKRPQLVKDIHNAGHLIGSHGMHHLNVKNLTKEQFKREIIDSKHAIEDITSDKVYSYRAPEFSLEIANKSFYSVLAEAGYQYSSSAKISIFKADNRVKNINTDNGIISEFALPCLPVFNKLIPFSGGTYMKLIPFYMLPILKQYITMIYAHPHDFATKTPTIVEINGFKSYLRSRQIGVNYEKKIKYLLKESKIIKLI